MSLSRGKQRYQFPLSPSFFSEARSALLHERILVLGQRNTPYKTDMLKVLSTETKLIDLIEGLNDEVIRLTPQPDNDPAPAAARAA